MTPAAGLEGHEEAVRRPKAMAGRATAEEEHTAPPEPRVDLPPPAGESEPREAASRGGAAPPEAPAAGGDVVMEEVEAPTPPRSSTPAKETTGADGASASP